MANWADLPRDLLISIAGRIRLMEDYVVFGAVCSSWRAIATKENFKGIPLWRDTPCLMLAAEKDDNYRQFYSLLEDEIVTKIFLPETKGKKCMDAGFGWFFTIGQEGEASLVNPFTRDQIDLPHQNTIEGFEPESFCCPQIYYQKAALSSSPCQNPSDFVLVVIGAHRYLNLWRPGDKVWTKISSNCGTFYDVVHHKGKFYAINCAGMVVVYDIAGNKSRRVAQLFHGEMYYIAESSGKLLIVAREGVQAMLLEQRHDGHRLYNSELDLHLTYGTNRFRVSELDLVHKKWTQIQDLGDRALFLGHSVTVCIDEASRFPGIKANHIYFTDDYYESYLDAENGGGRDMGVYNLEDGNITPHFKGQSLSLIGPPIWFIPCSPCMSY